MVWLATVIRVAIVPVLVGALVLLAESPRSASDLAAAVANWNATYAGQLDATAGGGKRIPALTLGPIAVPDQYFRDFFRGCIDGDGSVLTYIDRYHTVKNAEYVYGRLYVSLVSASHGFVEWMLATFRRLLSVRGSIDVDSRAGRRPIYRLRFAKRDSIRIVRWMYYTPDVACLGRKRIKAERFLSGEHPRILGVGGVSEQVDDTDSKSVARKGVGVRVPSPLPTPILDSG